MSRIRTNKSCIAGTGRWMGLLALVLTTTLGWGQSSKLSKDLQSLPSTSSVNVIVQYYNPPSTTDANAAKSVGATNGKALGLIKGNKYGMTLASAQKLLSLDTNVKYISVDRNLRAAMDNADVAVGEIGRAHV